MHWLIVSCSENSSHNETRIFLTLLQNSVDIYFFWFLKIEHPALCKKQAEKTGSFSIIQKEKRPGFLFSFWITMTLFFCTLLFSKSRVPNFQKAGCPIFKNSGCRLTGRVCHDDVDDKKFPVQCITQKACPCPFIHILYLKFIQIKSGWNLDKVSLDKILIKSW